MRDLFFLLHDLEQFSRRHIVETAILLIDSINYHHQQHQFHRKERKQRHLRGLHTSYL